MTYNLPMQEIIEKYLNGMSTYELAKKYLCSPPTIVKKLRDNNIKIRLYKKLSVKEICEKYLSGINTSELAKEYKCAKGTIRKRLRDNGIKIRTNSESHIGLNRGEDHLDYIDLPLEKICEKYLNGMSSVDLAKEYKCSYNTIICRLRDNGIEIRSSHDSHIGLQKGKDSSHYINLPMKEICEKYLNGMSSIDLAKEYGCTDSTIGRRLHDNGIKIRTMSESRIGKRKGKNNPNWKGGISKSEYCHLFNLPLKEAIRLYFDNKCFIDNKPEENKRALSVHHVNYDKGCGCNATQFCIFIPVKSKWNATFNGSKDKNRWYWYSFLMNKIFIEHPNYFAFHIPVWGMNELEYNYSYIFEKFRRNILI